MGLKLNIKTLLSIHVEIFVCELLGTGWQEMDKSSPDGLIYIYISLIEQKN